MSEKSTPQFTRTELEKQGYNPDTWMQGKPEYAEQVGNHNLSAESSSQEDLAEPAQAEADVPEFSGADVTDIGIFALEASGRKKRTVVVGHNGVVMTDTEVSHALSTAPSDRS